MAKTEADRVAHLAQLARPVVQPGRKVPVCLRLDVELIEAVRALARRRGVKYQTLMQQLLAAEVVRETGAA